MFVLVGPLFSGMSEQTQANRRQHRKSDSPIGSLTYIGVRETSNIRELFFPNEIRYVAPPFLLLGGVSGLTFRFRESDEHRYSYLGTRWGALSNSYELRNH